MVRKLLGAFIGLLLSSATAQAVCVTPLAGLDATSTSRTFLTVLDGSSNCIGTTVIVDGTAGANKTAVKAASTAAVATDPALVVAVSPNNTIAVTQSGTWNIGTVTTLPAITFASPQAVTQSGTWTVQPGNTANTTPWLTTARVVGNTGAIVDFAGQNVAAPANAIQFGCQFNTTPSTITTGNASPCQMDSAGNVLVKVANVNSNGRTTPANSSPVVLPDVCQETGTFAPISITSATTTRIITPSASNRTYICHIFLQSAIANNVAIVEGTGGTCGTGTAGVVGGTTTANGVNLAANEGWSAGTGGFSIWATAGTNVDFCLITSSAGPVAGHVKYVQRP